MLADKINIRLEAALFMATAVPFTKKKDKTKSEVYSSSSFALNSPLTVASTTDSYLSFSLPSSACKHLFLDFFLWEYVLIN